MTILGNFGHMGAYLALALAPQSCFNVYVFIRDCTLHFLCYSYTIFSITLTFLFSLGLCHYGTFMTRRVLFFGFTKNRGFNRFMGGVYLGLMQVELYNK